LRAPRWSARTAHARGDKDGLETLAHCLASRQAWDDDACNPVVRAAVGVTLDAYGNRLPPAGVPWVREPLMSRSSF
jgi:hypothetical protein